MNVHLGEIGWRGSKPLPKLLVGTEKKKCCRARWAMINLKRAAAVVAEPRPMPMASTFGMFHIFGDVHILNVFLYAAVRPLLVQSFNVCSTPPVAEACRFQGGSKLNVSLTHLLASMT